MRDESDDSDAARAERRARSLARHAESACGDLTDADAVDAALRVVRVRRTRIEARENEMKSSRRAQNDDARGTTNFATDPKRRAFCFDAQTGALHDALRSTRELMLSHGRAATLDAPGSTYVVPESARRRLVEETTRAMEEYERATSAPLRVVALGRSGVGKSHVLNGLLRELASRGDARGRVGTGGANGKLTLTKMRDHDERAEEAEEDKARAMEDDWEDEGGAALDADASAFAPPPPLDRDTSAAVYMPRHMRGREIRGDAFKDSEADAIRKEKLKEAAKKAQKKGQKVKPSYVLYKEHQEARDKEAAKKATEEAKRQKYDAAIAAYEIPVRKKKFPPPPTTLKDFLENDPRLKNARPPPFLLPEGDVMDTTSVASSVRTSDAFRVSLVYFSEDVVKQHVHALQYAVRQARAIESARKGLGFYAESYVKKELKARGLEETTLLDFRTKPKEGEAVPDDGYGLPSVLRVACAMVGLDPNISTLADLDESDVAIPAEYIERLGKRVEFEYKTDRNKNGKPDEPIDYTDERTFQRALRATKHTVFTQTHIPSSCWGLLREVRIDIPVPPQKRGLVLIDAPGAGDSDPARDRHLVAALRNAAAVICLGDSREVTGDIVRSLHKSGFLQQLAIRPATRRFINAVQGDRIWGSTATTLKRASALLKRKLGRDVSVEELAKDFPPVDEEIQWAIDRVINENTVEIATVRRAELLKMLMDQTGSVRELKQTANAVIAVAWKFLEFRLSWAKVLDPEKFDVQSITGHGSLNATLEELKRARQLKAMRRVTRRVHDVLKAFCVAAEPLCALPTCSDDSLRGFYDDIEFRLGEGGAYAARRVYELAHQFCTRVIAVSMKVAMEPLDIHAIKHGRAAVVREVLTKNLRPEERIHDIRTPADVRGFIIEAVDYFGKVLEATFYFNFNGKNTPQKPRGLLFQVCESVNAAWCHSLVSDQSTGELMFGALVKNQIASLAGPEDDPKRAMMRALFNLALTKFKLSPAHRYAYMNSAKVAGESTTRLWLECTKNIQIEINRQLKSVTAGLMCAFHPLDETTEVPPPEGVRAMMTDVINAISHTACTMNDLIIEKATKEIEKFYTPYILIASEDAMQACLTCMSPYVKKQVMPEFRARVAKPSMFTVISPDVKLAHSHMTVTSLILGSEAREPLSRAEKAKKLIALSEIGALPFQLTKPPVLSPAITDAIKAADDGINVGLDEFPLQIHMPAEAPAAPEMEANEEESIEVTEQQIVPVEEEEEQIEPVEEDEDQIEPVEEDEDQIEPVEEEEQITVGEEEEQTTVGEEEEQITVGEEEQTTVIDDREESIQGTLVPDADPDVDTDEIEVQSPAPIIKSTKGNAQMEKATSPQSKSSTPMKDVQTQTEYTASAKQPTVSASPRREIAVQTDDFGESPRREIAVQTYDFDEPETAVQTEETAERTSSEPSPTTHDASPVENPPPHSSSKSDLTATTTTTTTNAGERTKKRKMMCANELHAMPSVAANDPLTLAVNPVPGPLIALTSKIPTSDAKKRAKAERDRADFSPLKHTFDFDTDGDSDGDEPSPRPPVARILRKRPKRAF